MKALIKEKVTLTVEGGSIVNISESQFKALGDKAAPYVDRAEAVPEVAEDEKPAKKTAKGKK